MFTISDCLLSIIFLSPLKMASFSARHRLHLLPPHLYDGAVETMDHFIDGSTPLSFARQTSFDSSVAFLLLQPNSQIHNYSQIDVSFYKAETSIWL